MNHEDKYLKVPLTLTHGSLEKVPLRESISQYVGIIIGSRFGAFPFNPEFGCKIWDSEFTYFSPQSLGEFNRYIRNAISEHEKRLEKEELKVEIKQAFIEPYRNKASLIAKVEGTYKEDGKEQPFEEEYVFWQPRWHGGKKR